MAVRHKVRIIYKSGHTEDFTCSECKVQFGSAQNKLTQIIWQDAKPEVAYMNWESIATVLKLK